MPPFTPHDLRRTVVTRLSDLGIAPHIIEKIVNHKMTGVMGIYNRSEYLPESQKAIELWNRYLQDLTGAGDNVMFLAHGFSPWISGCTQKKAFTALQGTA